MSDLRVKAFVLIQRVAARHAGQAAAAVRDSGLTAAQYNVLRILRGAGPEGLACNAIAGRMITPDPDMTRLLDKLEARGFVVRARGQADRRVVSARITPAGLEVLARLDEPILRTHEQQFRGFGDEQLRRLIELLEAIQ